MTEPRVWMMRHEVDAQVLAYPELRAHMLKISEEVMRHRYPIGDNEVRLVKEMPFRYVETGEMIEVDGEDGLVPEVWREVCEPGEATCVAFIFEAREA